jgi:UDP-2,3-diacylglucosamine hydrolase
MSVERVVVVGDAHFGIGDPADEQAFRDFLAALPEFGTRLVVVGDLFDFWFEYQAVIPRRPFRTVAALAALAGRGFPVDLFGGNHDRWGGTFWPREVGIPFHAETADLTCAGRLTQVVHGDGLSDFKLGAKVMHALLRSRLLIRLFGALPPAIGFGIADLLSDTLGERNRSGAVADRAAALQEAWARALLDRRPEVGLVVLGHTHRRALLDPAPGRWYLNAGQWMTDRHYAVVTPERIDLLAWPERPAL